MLMEEIKVEGGGVGRYGDEFLVKSVIIWGDEKKPLSDLFFKILPEGTVKLEAGKFNCRLRLA